VRVLPPSVANQKRGKCGGVNGRDEGVTRGGIYSRANGGPGVRLLTARGGWGLPAWPNMSRQLPSPSSQVGLVQVMLGGRGILMAEWGHADERLGTEWKG